MPDRYGTPDDERDESPVTAAEIAQAARDAELAARHAELELAAQARNACTLCDADGYRNGLICDHVDHAPAARRGIAACRAALTKGHTA
ncbi:MAG: hypothetical protein E6R06_21810 [Mycobacterium sp.]|nr:MAG: hypothetical protein E6R06_21810 [Mycobacterium sp.]